jgi:hypothetical protein
MGRTRQLSSDRGQGPRHQLPAQGGATQVSALQIVRNFQNAVKKDGGTILGDYSGEVYPSLPETAVKYLGESPSGSSFDRYTTMTLTKDGTEFWIYLCASEGDQDYMLLLVEKQR